MKQIVQLVVWPLFLANAPLNASALPDPKETSASDANTAAFAALPNLSAADILNLSPEKYRAQTGRQLSFKERISLRLVQKSIRKHLKRGESFQVEDVVKGNKFHFMVEAFLLGVLLGWIGVIICLLAFKKARRDALISSCIGAISVLLIILILLLSGAIPV